MSVPLTKLRPLHIPGIDIVAHWRLEFKLAAMWLGVYHKQYTESGYEMLDLWVCLVPMFPIFITIRAEEVEE